MNTRAKSIGLALALAIIVLGVMYYTSGKPAAPGAQTVVATVHYSCNGGKTITAVYYNGEGKPGTDTQPPVPGGKAEVTLSDGRALSLPQTVSADGARYANADESFVLWSKGRGALVLENNVEKSYTGCIEVAPEPSGVSLPQVYSNGQTGFSLRLPAGYATTESYKYQEMGPGKDIFGTKFTIPLTTATGTNLSADTYVSVEEIPNAASCSASLFLQHASSTPMTDAGMTYSIASTTGAAAGNRYEETVYALPGTNPCIAVRYWIHYGVFQNYPPGAVKEFDAQALRNQFDAIRRTLTIVR